MRLPVAQMVNSLPAKQETRIQSLGQEYSLEKEMATHSSILAWETLWTEEPGGLQSMGSEKSRTPQQLNNNVTPCDLHFFHFKLFILY